MTPGSRAGVRLLLRLDGSRALRALRDPRPGVWAGFLLPLGLLAGALWAAGPRFRPDLADPQGRVLLGVAAAALPALGAYGVLFRSADEGLLRSLGVPPEARFGRGALRLLALALAGAAAMLLPWVAGDAPLARPAATALGGATAAWGASLWALARAAGQVAARGYRTRGLGRAIAFDPALAGSAPLVFAPLLPLVAGAGAAAWAGGNPAGFAAAVGVGALGAGLGVRPYARALPRFAPRAAEMAFAPAAEAGERGLVIGRGLARVLPRRAGAVRARDAAVVGRRFRWAGRGVAPVAVVSVLALLRAGDDPAVRGWVAAAAAGVLAAQVAATVALGRLERRGPRWIDRAQGIGSGDRFLGRWALAFGLALGVTVPLGLVWGLGPAGTSGWLWIAAAALSATTAAAASLAAAGR